MSDDVYACPVCEQEGTTVEMKFLHDLLECPRCHTSFRRKGSNPLPRWIDEWQATAEANYPLMRPPFEPEDLGNPFLLELYRDAYIPILTGRPNAGIVMLGVLLEALVKEVIYLNEGKPFKGEFGPALDHAEEAGYIRREDAATLRSFKDRIRNPYQHQDLAKILRGKAVRVWPIQVDPNNPVKSIEEAMAGIKTGERQPKVVLADMIGSLGIAVKLDFDKKTAIPLFNSVHDFLIQAQVRYLSAEKYEQFNKRFGNPIESRWFTPP